MTEIEEVLVTIGKKATEGVAVKEFASAVGTGIQNGGRLLLTYNPTTEIITNVTAGAAGEAFAAGSAAATTSAAAKVASQLPTVAEAVTVAGGGTTVTTGAGIGMSVGYSSLVAAAAPALGIAIGAGAYKANPRFWTELSMKVAPFLYDDNDTVQSVMIANGEMYYPKEVVDAIHQYFQESGLYDPDEIKIPTGYIQENEVITNLLSSDQLLAMAYEHAYKYINDSKYDTQAQTIIQNILTLQEDSHYHRLREKYKDCLCVINSGTCTKNAVELFFYNKRVGDVLITSSDTNPYHGGYTWAGDNYYTAGRVFLGNDKRYQRYVNGAMYLVGCNTTTVSKLPEHTKLMADEPVIDPNKVKDFITGTDEQGNPITKPYIPLKLPTSTDGSTTSTPQQSQDSSTSDAETGQAVIQLILDQTKPQPNPDYDPSVDPSTKPNSATQSTPNTPVKIPVAEFTPVKPPDDSGTTPPIVTPIASNADGLITVYNPTKEQLKAFGKWLWTTWSSDILDTLSKMFNNPMEAVIGLHLLYATPSTSGSSTIKAGYLDSGINSLLVDKQYTTINCGSVYIGEYWKNYLDYAPYTTINCYLPFIGMVELDPRDVINCGVNITYTIDAYSGSCIAQVTTARKGFEAVTYQYSGNCSVQIPISAGNYSSILSTAIGLAASGLATYATGGAAAPMLAGATASMMKTGTNVSHSGSFGASHGAMGFKKPYIEVRSRVQKVVKGYNNDYGYPSHTKVIVGDCKGFLKLKEVNVISSSATSEEKKMIEELLKSGVYVD